MSFGDSLSKKLEAYAENIKTAEVSVGFMENAVYPDGTPVAAVAFWNEFGKGTQPPRPFFRTMIANESGTWANKIARIMASNGNNAEEALALMGEDIGGALRQSINDLTSPPLAKSTILARAAGEKYGAIKSPTIAKPLIDTAVMLNSIAYRVNDGESVKVAK